MLNTEDPAAHIKSQSFSVSAGNDSTITSVTGGDFKISDDKHSAKLESQGGAVPGGVSVTVSFSAAGEKTVSLGGSVRFTDDSSVGDSADAKVTVSAASLTVTSEATSVCAGALDSFPHQSEITATLKDSEGKPVAGKEISFSVETSLPGASAPLTADDPDADLRATVSPASATTDADGIAHTTLTSSQQIGATAVVKATTDKGLEGKSESVTMEDAPGEMSVDGGNIPADGESTADVYLALYSDGKAVVGHNISFSIVSVKDENGDEVEPEPDGTFPGYGSIRTVQGTTNDNGAAYGTYTAGTSPGVITFESADSSVVLNDDGSDDSLASSFKPNFLTVAYSSTQRLAAAARTRRPRRRKRGGAGSARRVARVSMNFVKLSDQSGNTSIPVFSPAAAVAAANKVWFSRAQVQFYIKNNAVFDHKLPGSEANAIDGSAVAAIHQQVETNLRDVLKKSLASLTLYFCKEIVATPRYSIGGAAPYGGPYIMMQDGNASIATTVLSHEIGHSLNEPHIINLLADGTENPKGIYLRPNVMYPKADYGGEALNTTQRNRANAFATATFR